MEKLPSGAQRQLSRSARPRRWKGSAGAGGPTPSDRRSFPRCN